MISDTVPGAMSGIIHLSLLHCKHLFLAGKFLFGIVYRLSCMSVYLKGDGEDLQLD